MHLNVSDLISAVVATYVGVLTIYGFVITARKERAERIKLLQHDKLIAEGDEETTRLSEILADRDDDIKENIVELKDLIQRVVDQSVVDAAITKKELEHSLKLYSILQAVVTASPSAIIITDWDCNIILWNGAATALFGYLEHEIVGRNVSILIPEDMKGAHYSGLDRYHRTHEPRILGQTTDVFGMHKNGTKFRITMSLSGSETGTGDKYFCAIITGRDRRKEDNG